MKRKKYIESYMSHSWIMIPCMNKKKNPLIKEWQKKNGNSKEEIQYWDNHYKDYNIGVLTGLPSGIVMIDQDGELGEKCLRKISKGDLPKTATFKTPGNGMRYVYRIPKGTTLKTKTITIEGEHQEVCLMSDGKFSIVPPSIHPNGGEYEWLPGFAPWEIEIAEAPGWMVEMMTSKNNTKPSNSVNVKNATKAKSNSLFILKKLCYLCPKFKKLLKIQKSVGLHEEEWFNVINLFCSCGCEGSSLIFSKLSNKHDKRSEDRIDELVSKSYAPIKCTDLGCDDSEIFRCQGFLNFNKDDASNEIINSPSWWLKKFKMFNLPEDDVYKDVIKRLYPLKEYAIDENGSIYRVGGIITLISNFVAYTVEEIISTDGNNEDSKIKVVLILEGGNKLDEVIIDSSEFLSLDWITKKYGVKPYITTGKFNKKYMIELIQKLSSSALTKEVYTHTGWVEKDGLWSYLHAGGSIGSQGLEVNIDKQLTGYQLNDSLDINIAILTSMKFIEVASEEITIPLISLAFLSPLVSIIDPNNTPKFIIWMHGLTGSRKTSLAMCLLNHFGRFGNTPLMSFRDTANSIEVKSHILKDTLLLIDDFAPTMNSYEASKFNDTAERILRIYGDRVGRGRLNSNSNIKKTFYPRGLALVTGEDVPRGTSSTARYIGLEVKSDDVNLNTLTTLQNSPDSLSRTMYEYIEYVSQNIEEIRSFIDIEFKKSRQKYDQVNNLHGRIIDAVSWLHVGFQVYLKFIYEYMNIYTYERDELQSKCNSALETILNKQQCIYKDQEIENVFIETFMELINTNKVYVKDIKVKSDSEEMQTSNSKGTFVGYEDNEFFYLYPQTTYSEINKALANRGMKSSISDNTLWKLMKNKNLIKTEENQLKPKKTVQCLDGKLKRVRLIHLYKQNLSLIQ